jgi:signal peptidase II
MNIIKSIIDKKNLFLKKENIALVVMILFLFLLDRYSKILIIDNYSNSSFQINNFINLDLIWNTGIGFGLFSSSSPVIYNLITTSICIVIIILFFLAISSDKLDKIIYSTIISGALGNLYDRVTYNAVPDFIDLHYDRFHWFTFNVADILITVGIITYMIKDIFFKEGK